jgi:DNA-binding protein HU-beta
MTKTDLVAGIAAASGLTQADAARALNATTEGITQALAKGDSVSIVGFGTFKTSNRAARAGRNPKTGETIQIKAARVPRFVAGKSLKDAVR